MYAGPAAPRSAVRPDAPPPRLGQRGGRRPAGPAGAGRAPPGLRGRRAPRGWPRPPAAEVERRKRSRRLIDYDDLLVHLRDALVDPATGAAAAGPGPQPLPGGAGRRVPGHRPGAVGDPRERVPRSPHAGADRRPQAGDLRVPRRRRGHLPARPPGPAATARRSAPTGAATRRCSRRCGTCLGGAALGDERITVHPVEAARSRRAARRAPVPPLRLRVVRRARR